LTYICRKSKLILASKDGRAISVTHCVKNILTKI
jgi:hypothetical protein